MNIINYSIAFKALDTYVKKHNQSTPLLSQQVRQAMASTAKDIIKIYGLSLLKANSIRSIDKDNLPSLKTNNVQLAKMANASTRTMQRHLKRLIQAKIVTKKVWHGTNSGYEIWVNPDILLISPKKGVNNVKMGSEEHQILNTEKQLFKNNNTSICPHTYSSNNSYINNILIDVDKSKNVNLQKEKRSSLPLTASNESRNANSNETSGYTEVKSAKKINSAEGKVRIKRVTNQTAGEISELEMARSATLMIYINSLWKLAQNTIYKDVFLTERQIQKGQELLKMWYDPVPDAALSKVHQVYVERIGLVQKYLDKKPKTRFVQLPFAYFDPKNQYGFKGTKAWYEKHKKRQKEVQLKLILQAQIRRFLNNEKKDTTTQKPRLELFRECETRISKLGSMDLLQEFHASILNHSTYTFLQINT